MNRELVQIRLPQYQSKPLNIAIKAMFSGFLMLLNAAKTANMQSKCSEITRISKENHTKNHTDFESQGCAKLHFSQDMNQIYMKQNAYVHPQRLHIGIVFACGDSWTFF